MASYQTDLIKHAMDVDALKFGSFTLKSGRCVQLYLEVALDLNTTSKRFTVFLQCGASMYWTNISYLIYCICSYNRTSLIRPYASPAII